MDEFPPASSLPDFNVFGVPYTGFVTLLAVLVYFLCMLRVGLGRDKYNVKAPSIEGPPAFQRRLRIQINTLEHLVLFLPLLWIAALSSRDEWAAVIGIFWPIGRVIYAISYTRNPDKRYPGFFLALGSSGALFALAAVQLVRSLLVWQ
jgi:glutathione S-transferase